MSSIYFHEDDFCQIEILPVENFEFCAKQAGLIADFADTNRSESGYTNTYIRSGPPTPLKNKKISKKSLARTLNNVLPKFDEVLTGYSSYRQKCQFTSAFGYENEVVIFFEEKNRIVANIWLTLNIKNENNLTTAHEILIALSKFGDFLIADWAWDYVERISSHERINKYLHERLERYSAN